MSRASWVTARGGTPVVLTHCHLLYVISLGFIISSGDRPGRRAKESVQRPAVVRTAGVEQGDVLAAIAEIG